MNKATVDKMDDPKDNNMFMVTGWEGTELKFSKDNGLIESYTVVDGEGK